MVRADCACAGCCIMPAAAHSVSKPAASHDCVDFNAPSPCGPFVRPRPKRYRNRPGTSFMLGHHRPRKRAIQYSQTIITGCPAFAGHDKVGVCRENAGELSRELDVLEV